MARRSPLMLSALSLVLASLPLGEKAAHATGMQGHIYMAQCAAENVSDARLRSIFDGYPMFLANGAFLVDSGYTMPDHDQGEIPHWEAFVEAYLQIIREKYEAPYDSAEAQQHIAILMGMAAHGITDSTFDSLIYARAEQVEPTPMDSFDTAMDIFLVHDMPRYFIPDLANDPDTLSEAFTRVEHPIPPDDIKSAIGTAKSGIAVVTNLLQAGADEYGMKYPWGRAHFLDPMTPGSYAFGSAVVMGYYRELLRRLDGDTSADQIVIGTYPNDSYPLVTLDATRPDGKVILFFGHGLNRDSINNNVVTVLGPDGMAVPASVEVFRGDTWANVLFIKPAQNWLPEAKYQVVLSPTIETLNGSFPSDDFVLSFTTCLPDEKGDCPAPTNPGPYVSCPKTEALYAVPPNEGGGGEGGAGGFGASGGGTTSSGPKDPNAESSGGCVASGATSNPNGVWGATLAMIVSATIAVGRRRQRSRRKFIVD